MAKHWPFEDKKLNATTIPPLPSKSTARSTISNKESLQQTFWNLITPNSTKLNGKKAVEKTRSKLADSQYSFNERQKLNEWNLKAQEGIITYSLPDSLPDGIALHAKLQKLMKTNTINLNDRHFWTTLENRFKKLRKVTFFFVSHILFCLTETFYRKIFDKIWNVYVKINNSMNKYLLHKVSYRIRLKKQSNRQLKNIEQKILRNQCASTNPIV